VSTLSSEQIIAEAEQIDVTVIELTQRDEDRRDATKDDDYFDMRETP
jgi:hypothetical protein